MNELILATDDNNVSVTVDLKWLAEIVKKSPNKKQKLIEMGYKPHFKKLKETEEFNWLRVT
jgi:hypothetical protein